MSKKLVVFNVLTVACCFLFSVFQWPFNADISIVALPFSLIFTGALAWLQWNVILKKRLNFLPALRKVIEYVPFVTLVSFVFRRAGENGTQLWYDILTIIFWIIASVCSLFANHYLSRKRIYIQNPDFEAIKSNFPEKKFRGIKKILFETVDWIDALIQAAFTVSLFNIFVFQLYGIPSESMVPEFFINDRVFVFKTYAGPKFPLSNIGLPTLKNFKRGDIVVFRNPHYSNDRKSEVKNFVSQLVYMLTFTTVNLNVDEAGDQKADPLVKRITGVAGEQLMMQDGILYHRTKENDEFTPVAEDALWAEWNLSGITGTTANNIAVKPLTVAQYNTMVKVEEKRNALNMTDVKNECVELSATFTKIRNSQNELNILQDGDAIPVLFSREELTTENLTEREFDITTKLLSKKGGAEWFNAFMTDWTNSTPNNNLYDEAMYRLNAMIKLNLGRIIVRNAELSMQGSTRGVRAADQVRNVALEELKDLFLYTQLINGRNMPIFPANTEDGKPQYIPENCYFMMGDNRFNSQDLRHSYENTLVPITKTDAYSIQYISCVEPQYLDESRIIGAPTLRFFPLNRFGVPGLTGVKSK